MQELSDGCREARRRQVEERLISVQQEMETAKEEEEEVQEAVNGWEEDLQTLSRQQDEGMIDCCGHKILVVNIDFYCPAPGLCQPWNQVQLNCP